MAVVHYRPTMQRTLNRFAQVLDQLDVRVAVTEAAIVVNLLRPAVAQLINYPHDQAGFDFSHHG
jgi:hypothetical protein